MSLVIATTSHKKQRTAIRDYSGVCDFDGFFAGAGLTTALFSASPLVFEVIR